MQKILLQVQITLNYNMKLKYYYKINRQGVPILGSNISRISKPIVGRWKEIKNVCCEEQANNCICGFKFYVKVDSLGNPINQTLIKRVKRPETENERFLRISGNACCVYPNIIVLPLPDITPPIFIIPEDPPILVMPPIFAIEP